MTPSERRAWEHRYGHLAPPTEAVVSAPRQSKYGNNKVVVQGIVFDSVGESNRYIELQLLEAAGAIQGIEVKPVFQLVVNGMLICKYEADFAYFDREKGKRVVEDFKSEVTKTRAYRIKKKLMRAIHGIDIVEVMK